MPLEVASSGVVRGETRRVRTAWGGRGEGLGGKWQRRCHSLEEPVVKQRCSVVLVATALPFMREVSACDRASVSLHHLKVVGRDDQRNGYSLPYNKRSHGCRCQICTVRCSLRCTDMSVVMNRAMRLLNYCSG